MTMTFCMARGAGARESDSLYPADARAAKKSFRGSIADMRTPLIVVTLFAGALMSATATAEEIPVFIGTAGNPDADTTGIYFCRFDPVTGALTQPVLAARVRPPSW